MRNEKDNRGFSLVELMVGIVILAVIVVPLAHAFITSAKTSNKARNIRSETVAASNILEKYEATTIQSIIDGIKSGVNPFSALAGSVEVYARDSETGIYNLVTASSKEEADGPGYKIHLSDVTESNKTYDAVLTLDAATRFLSPNSAKIVDYKPMDAVYIQPDPVTDQDNNPDIAAARNFASQASIDSGTAVSHEEFIGKMKREVTITIKKLGGETGIISCTALFHYEASFTYTLRDDSKKPPVITTYTKEYVTDINNDFYSGSYADDEDGIYGLYFFFYPNQNTAAGSDKLEILNRDNVEMSIYLIKQTDEADMYNPVINLRERYVSASSPQHALMFYNKKNHTYRFYTGYPGGDGYNDFWYKTNSFSGMLVDTNEQNRIYDVKLQLFDAGGGEALVTIDASSVE